VHNGPNGHTQPLSGKYVNFLFRIMSFCFHNTSGEDVIDYIIQKLLLNKMLQKWVKMYQQMANLCQK